MATSQKFRKTAFVPTADQATLLTEFEKVRATLSTRKQCQYLSTKVGMTTGDIAVFLQVRFQQVYQATH